jgi:hypothetical protein
MRDKISRWFWTVVLDLVMTWESFGYAKES